VKFKDKPSPECKREPGGGGWRDRGLDDYMVESKREKDITNWGVQRKKRESKSTTRGEGIKGEYVETFSEVGLRVAGINSVETRKDHRTTLTYVGG